jgi:triphosphoribosyl-dephospho-CoA synthetase
LALVPQAAKSFIISKCAEKLARVATGALREELDTTPKPGLVDKEDHGAHDDMTYDLMRGSIDAIHPYFEQLAGLGMAHADASIETIFHEARRIGIDAEQAMLAATEGINTHRGAIFSLGLCIVSSALLVARGRALTSEEISKTVSSIAVHFERQADSNGGKVHQKYNTKGALDNARDGYRDLFTTVLPAYMEMVANEVDRNTANIRCLLLIMSVLDDSNVYHRKGAEVASIIKARASELYENYSMGKLGELNTCFIQNNISPGGSADMLALIIFLERILNQITINKLRDD